MNASSPHTQAILGSLLFDRRNHIDHKRLTAQGEQRIAQADRAKTSRVSCAYLQGLPIPRSQTGLGNEFSNAFFKKFGCRPGSGAAQIVGHDANHRSRHSINIVDIPHQFN